MTRYSSLVTRYVKYWLPVLFWMGVIFGASSQPKLPFVLNKRVDSIAKKAAHVTEYGVLTFLLWRAISKERECKICDETLSIFISVLAREAANLVLKVVATGGLYIGGGIPPRIISRIKDGGYMEAFVEKGVFRDFLSAVPVYVIMNPKAALIGTARYGLELFRE